ncbi:unnamed protein product [Chondrus crispus]|uniref:Uncharacterized protein n=1 Tax=Chondrus crispus TaxID=2769 RepID=R7QRD4_CHOCR|nr:unnamed protein product [Chondrus crispus]CDF40031.1 unnamed protein product [Chondrus crispus]|eukprot:XP_005710325.1 unnamed protein product [Chondrus crispus]
MITPTVRKSTSPLEALHHALLEQMVRLGPSSRARYPAPP